MMQCLVGPYSTERVIHSSPDSSHMDEVNLPCGRPPETDQMDAMFS